MFWTDPQLRAEVDRLRAVNHRLHMSNAALATHAADAPQALAAHERDAATIRAQRQQLADAADTGSYVVHGTIDAVTETRDNGNLVQAVVVHQFDGSVLTVGRVSPFPPHVGDAIVFTVTPRPLEVGDPRLRGLVDYDRGHDDESTNT